MFASRLFRFAFHFSRAVTTLNVSAPVSRKTVASFGTQARQQQRYQYQSFGQRQTLNFFSRWSRSPTFTYQVVGLGLLTSGVYVYNQDTVPVTGRRRFNVVSLELEKALMKDAYEQTLQQYRGRILPDSDSRTRLVRQVLQRLIPQSGLEGEDWKIHVVEEQEPNAFVLPGGKVFVHTGILPICKDTDGIAAVLGHEIAHNVARHTAERLSKEVIIVLLLLGAQLFTGGYDSFTAQLFDWILRKPASRKQESEADEIGLYMMARSCYDPEGAVTMWQRMAAQERVKIPQFMSTHPGSENREETLRNLLPKALDAYQQSDCAPVRQQYTEFRNSVGREGLRWA